MNYIEIKMSDEICRLSWEDDLSDIEKMTCGYVIESFKQVLMGVGYQPDTVNKHFREDEDPSDEGESDA